MAKRSIHLAHTHVYPFNQQTLTQTEYFTQPPVGCANRSLRVLLIPGDQKAIVWRSLVTNASLLVKSV